MLLDKRLFKIERAGYTGRYAPSPTGRLHLGNLRTALVAWKRCRKFNGTYILRIEDTDTTRVVAGSEAMIPEDLRRIGLSFDEGPCEGGLAGPYRQSERSNIYTQALLQLGRAGYLYPCRCSRKDLQATASAPHGIDGPTYPGTCRPEKPIHETDWIEERLRKKSDISNMSVRFRTHLFPVVRYADQDLGMVVEHLEQQHGDFVLLRKDGLWAYQLACAVDDAVMGITEVVRGEDLRTSAGRQVAIMQALGFVPPAFLHVPLVKSSDGDKLSKRDGAEGLNADLPGNTTDVHALQTFLMSLPTMKTIS